MARKEAQVKVTCRLSDSRIYDTDEIDVHPIFEGAPIGTFNEIHPKFDYIKFDIPCCATCAIPLEY